MTRLTQIVGAIGLLAAAVAGGAALQRAQGPSPPASPPSQSERPAENLHPTLLATLQELEQCRASLTVAQRETRRLRDTLNGWIAVDSEYWQHRIREGGTP